MKALLKFVGALSLAAMAQLASATVITHGVGGTYTENNGVYTGAYSDFDRAEFMFTSQYVDTITVANTGSGWAHDHGTPSMSELQVYNGTEWITVSSAASGGYLALGDMFASPVTFGGMYITGMRLNSTGWVGDMYHSVNYGMTYELTGTAPSDVPEPASLALLGLGAAGLAAARRKKAA